MTVKRNICGTVWLYPGIYCRMNCKVENTQSILVLVNFRFVHDKRDLPVLWHQSLLTFVQRYKEDISSDQKEALMELLRAHAHAQITPEVRRELQNSKSRDKEFESADVTATGDMQVG